MPIIMVPVFILIENHVITSVQVKVKSFRPDTSDLLQLTAVSMSSRAPCVVWVSRVTTKVGCRLGGECACLCLCLAMDFL